MGPSQLAGWPGEGCVLGIVTNISCHCQGRSGRAQAAKHVRPWSRDEIARLEKALLACMSDPRTGMKWDPEKHRNLRSKDFRKCAAAVGTRSVQECVQRYYQRGSTQPGQTIMPDFDRLESKRNKNRTFGRHTHGDESCDDDVAAQRPGGTPPRARGQAPVPGAASTTAPRRARPRDLVRRNSMPLPAHAARNAEAFRTAFIAALLRFGLDFYQIAKAVPCSAKEARKFHKEHQAELERLQHAPRPRDAAVPAAAAAGGMHSFPSTTILPTAASLDDMDTASLWTHGGDAQHGLTPRPSAAPAHSSATPADTDTGDGLSARAFASWPARLAINAVRSATVLLCLGVA
jgi:hypothetical protein